MFGALTEITFMKIFLHMLQLKEPIAKYSKDILSEM